MMAPLNIFSPSSGKPIMTPTQDITLGCYYLTAEPRQPRKEGDRHRLFATKDEVIFAHVEGDLRTRLQRAPDCAHPVDGTVDHDQQAVFLLSRQSGQVDLEGLGQPRVPLLVAVGRPGDPDHPAVVVTEAAA
jgi:hypothetical protein